MEKKLYCKSQCYELTKHYTPELFLGVDFKETFIDTYFWLKHLVEENAPKVLVIGGYDFRFAFGPYVDSYKNKNIVSFEYQSTEKIGNEWPVLQINIAVWRTRKGNVKANIIRDGVIYQTKFW